MRKKDSFKDKLKKKQAEKAKEQKAQKERYARKKARQQECENQRLLNERREAPKPSPIVKDGPKSATRLKVEFNGQVAYLPKAEIAQWEQLTDEEKMKNWPTDAFKRIEAATKVQPAPTTEQTPKET